jgi:3-deoxy-D-manno-octulosonic-acid transferase
LYALFIQFYYYGISIAAIWNKKAAQWKQGRKHLLTELEQTFSKPHAVIWIHAASAGEFEQAKPVMEALKQAHPQYKILVTFFSPSGYPGGKKFALADYVFYLPLDTKKNAERFVDIVQPKLVVFVKYDFWYHHLKAVHNHNVPLLLISAIFRKDQAFFKRHGRFYLGMLRLFTHLFVQDETSYGLLKKFGINHCSVAGDTRFDRVLTIAKNVQPVPFVEEFVGGKKTIVAGSTWPDDERMLYGVLKKFAGIKAVMAPHEVDETHIKSVAQLFQKPILYSSLKRLSPHEKMERLQQADVLIIDNVGMLSRLYNYATIAYIGGGFTRGIHNTLEAAVFGKPVLFGPNYQKFREARELIATGGAFSYNTEEELIALIENLLSDEKALKQTSSAAAGYVRRNGGATETLLRYIQENRLLTN